MQVGNRARLNRECYSVEEGAFLVLHVSDVRMDLHKLIEDVGFLGGRVGVVVKLPLADLPQVGTTICPKVASIRLDFLPENGQGS